MACWCKSTKDSTWSKSLIVGTKVFMLTPIDEKTTPINGVLKGLFATKDYTCTLFISKGSEPKIFRPT